MHERKSIRSRDYDYSSEGMYFMTICTKARACLFGDIRDGEVQLNRFGKIMYECWNDLPNHYANVELDTYVIMPNHFHGIILLVNGIGSNSVANVGAGLKPAPTKCHALPEIVRGFKTFSSRRINADRNTPGTSVWQRNYYERVIRHEEELFETRKYIQENSLKWELDPEYVGSTQ